MSRLPGSPGPMFFCWISDRSVLASVIPAAGIGTAIDETDNYDYSNLTY